LKDSDVRVACTGGSLVSGRECFVGHFAENFIRQIKADALFFSSQGVSENGDITDSSEEEIALRRAMIESSKEQYFLCDGSKVGKDFPFVLCNVADINTWIDED
jgi:DeoR/GlpR family transcriptional regulator of sugar metabolism